MEISVVFQAQQAAAAIILGLAAGLLYDVLRSIRYRFPHWAVTYLTDGLFWTICTFSLFIFGMTVSGGRQRAFVFATAGAGFALYLWLFSCVFLPICKFVLNVMISAVKTLLIPLKFAIKIGKKLEIFAKKLFPNLQNRRIIKGAYFQIRKPKSSAIPRKARKGAGYDEVKTRRYHY